MNIAIRQTQGNIEAHLINHAMLWQPIADTSKTLWELCDALIVQRTLMIEVRTFTYHTNLGV